jgi:membrane-bound inhibitor of C-type lysozyme
MPYGTVDPRKLPAARAATARRGLIRMSYLRIRSYLLIAAAICTVLLSPACAKRRVPDRAPKPGARVPGGARTYVYECDDAYGFTARIEGETAWVFLPGETVALPHVTSASGVKYSDGRVTLWSEGNEAALEVEGGERYECSNNPAKAVWEHAKLSGVDFRAVGNEPGWYLEIIAQSTIVLVTDYGNSRNEFPLPEPIENREARTTQYVVASAGHALTILLEGRLCSDTMSGEQFETTVTVTLDDRQFSGCGRALH